jgi:Mg2+ and Co2+ transporter CorA
MTDKIADKLIEISDRLGDRKDQDAQDIDWLISQVALLRRRNDLLREDVATFKKQLTDAQDVAAALYRLLGVRNG